MLIKEAKWFQEIIKKLDFDEIFPMLNLGCGSLKIQKKEQPWIEHYVFGPLKNEKHVIINSDIEKSPGVDLVGDLTDKTFINKLSKLKFRSVFCTNLLEHIPNKEEICRIISSIITNGGYIFVSCPHEYPSHPAPIDNKFRPNIHELAGLFPFVKIVNGEIVDCGKYYETIQNKFIIILRVFLPFYRPKRWFSVVKKLLWLNRSCSVTCILLKKI